MLNKLSFQQTRNRPNSLSLHVVCFSQGSVNIWLGNQQLQGRTELEGKKSTHGRQLSPVKLSGKDEHSSTFPHMVSHTLAILYSPFDCFPAVDFCFVSEYPSKAHRLPTNCPKHFCAAGKLRKSGRNIFFFFLSLCSSFLSASSSMDKSNVSYSLRPPKSLWQRRDSGDSAVWPRLFYFSSFLPLCPLLIYRHYHISSNCFGSFSPSLLFSFTDSSLC